LDIQCLLAPANEDYQKLLNKAKSWVNSVLSTKSGDISTDSRKLPFFWIVYEILWGQLRLSYEWFVGW